MEKLSLEKFNKFELSNNSTFKVKGGAEPTETGANRHYQTVGDIKIASSYTADVRHVNGGRTFETTDTIVCGEDLDNCD